ncbi:MAG TPA: carboxypeptidase-like regulatory domain-containing protein, partial [Gemmataceae bacterium]|nr:carboxypeptidase-like regulatory domain-containing protein [Gemmataceae bacterium]
GKHKEYTVSAEGSPYFNCTKMHIADSLGLDPITVDFELERGIAIRGRLLDRFTGKPIPGHVSYISSPDNPNLKDFATLGGLHVHAVDGGKTKADGSFTVIAAPGPGLLGASADDRIGYVATNLDGIKFSGNAILDVYHTVVPINPSRDDPQSATCDLVLEPSRVLGGSVIDPDGKPLAGALAAGLGATAEIFGFREAKLPTASFTAGVDPKRPRFLFFFHPEKRLAKLHPVRGDEAGTLMVRLEPLSSVTGRVLDANGNPRAGLKVAILHSFQREDYKGIPLDLIFDYPSWTKLIDSEAATDAEGKFRVEGLVPGLKYHLQIKDGESVLPGYTQRDLVPESNQIKDLGDLKDKPMSQKGTKE